MIVILDNYDQNDVDVLQEHLFKRQIHIFVRKENMYLGLEADSPFDFNFWASLLKCRFMFTPFGFEHDGKRYSVLSIIREEDFVAVDEDSHRPVMLDNVPKNGNDIEVGDEYHEEEDYYPNSRD